MAVALASDKAKPCKRGPALDSVMCMFKLVQTVIRI